MSDYISREAFKQEVIRLSTHYLNEWDTLGVLAAADRIPAADVQPVVRGKWMHKEITVDLHVVGQCSVCKERRRIDNYCPNCGADMRDES